MIAVNLLLHLQTVCLVRTGLCGCLVNGALPAFGPGDTVDVVVMDQNLKLTDQWVKAIVLGLRDDGACPLPRHRMLLVRSPAACR